MKKIISLLLFFSGLSLACSSPEEQRKKEVREGLEHLAIYTADAFITFANGQQPGHHIALSTNFFIESVKDITARALHLEKENRPMSVPVPEAPHSPHPLLSALAPTVQVLYSFRGEEDPASLAQLFCDYVETYVTKHTRCSSPIKQQFRPLTPRQD
jgi:hypothetical protein